MSVVVSVVMGSTSDWPTMKEACDRLEAFGVPYEKSRICSSNAGLHV